MLIKRLKDDSLEVPTRIDIRWNIVDTVIHVLRWDIDYDTYLKEYERDEKISIDNEE